VTWRHTGSRQWKACAALKGMTFWMIRTITTIALCPGPDPPPTRHNSTLFDTFRQHRVPRPRRIRRSPPGPDPPPARHNSTLFDTFRQHRVPRPRRARRSPPGPDPPPARHNSTLFDTFRQHRVPRPRRARCSPSGPGPAAHPTQFDTFRQHQVPVPCPAATCRLPSESRRLWNNGESVAGR
jgi:hypothetical protein